MGLLWRACWSRPCTQLLRVVAMVVIVVVWLQSAHGFVAAQLSSTFYQDSCPSVFNISKSVLQQELAKDPRVAASMLRLHFHDCFVNGCDGSLLLDDQPNLPSEKTAFPNLNSLRDLYIVDNIKSALEAQCPGVVSCADILAIAARDSITLSGGPPWSVLLGRRDGTTPNQALANKNLPANFENVSVLVSKFQTVGLNLQDTVTLSGAHSIGRARCTLFSSRLYNFTGTQKPDPTLNDDYLKSLQQSCPQNGNQSVVVPLEPLNVNTFSNQYFKNLLIQKGLLQSDQELYSIDYTGSRDDISFVQALNVQSLVKSYASNQALFFTKFQSSMIKMGNLSPLTGSQGQIRINCRVTNL